jgi:ABC-type molybdate transport system ATPase subunit
MIFVSIDTLVMSACERVIILEEGVVKASGTMEQLLKNNDLNGITH